MKLAKKTALITGGGSGIGAACAIALAGEGCHVAIAGRRPETLAEVARQFEGSPAIKTHPVDVADRQSVSTLFQWANRELGRIDILVNCAAQPAGQQPAPKLAGITDEIFWADINVKVFGYLRCAREVAPVMQRQHSGRIVNVSGLAARQTGSIVGSIRNISVAALTKNLADELGPHGISVTCVHPGFTRTEKTLDALRYRASVAGLSVEAIEQRLAEDTSIRHLVTAEEVAYVVAFLSSPKSTAISGDAIAVGGGKVGSIYY